MAKFSIAEGERWLKSTQENALRIAIKSRRSATRQTLEQTHIQNQTSFSSRLEVHTNGNKETNPNEEDYLFSFV